MTHGGAMARQPGTGRGRLGWLDACEQEVFEALQAQQPELAGAFAAQLPRARQHALQRLVSTLIRERLLSPEGPPREQALWQLPLGPEEALLVPVGRLGPFGRLEVVGAITHQRRGQLSPLRHVRDLTDLMALHPDPAAEPADWEALAEQVASSSAHLALSRAFFRLGQAHWRVLAERLHAATSLELARQLDPPFDPALFFEQLCVEGHNLHPAPKGRGTMTPAEVLEVAPEFHDAIPLRWVGVRRDHLEAFAWPGLDLEALLASTLGEPYERARDQLARRGHSPRDYVVLPVHPWQFERILPDVYAEELIEGSVVALEAQGPACRATTSLRTLVPIGTSGLALKLSLHCQLTSTMRSIARATVGNGPLIAQLLEEVLAREVQLAPHFRPMRELGGWAFRSNFVDADSRREEARLRGLSVVLREQPAVTPGPGELAIVASSLLSLSPVSGQPVLAEAVSELADHEGIPMGAAALCFFERYVHKLVPGFLTLMVRYGIGLEGHLQNCVVVVQAGSPCRIEVRDWEGCRIHLGRLASQGWVPELHRSGPLVTDSVNELHRKVYYSVFQSHLGELVQALCQSLRACEATLWEIVHRQTEQVFASFAGTPLADRAATDWDALYAATLEHKALTRMRLRAKGEHLFVPVPNPLHDLRALPVT